MDTFLEVIVWILLIFMVGLLIVTVVAGVMSLTPTIVEGEVYQKEFRKAHTTTRLMPLVTSNGKTTTTIMIPYVVHYPDRYVIFIQAWNEQRQKWDTEDFYLNKESWDAIQVGDWFRFDVKLGTDKEPYTRQRAG